MRAPLTPRLPLGLLCAGMIVLSAATARAQPGPSRVPQIADVEASLRDDPSYKVRVDAAIVLGRLAQPRSVPALVAALKDGHPTVRASVVYALGRFRSPVARDAVSGALRDPAPVVRHMAREALRQLGGGADESTPIQAGEPAIRGRRADRPSFEVKAVGDPEQMAGPILRSHMHDFLVNQLRPFGDVAPGERRGTYAVDGVIQNLTTSSSGRDVEVTCAVQLVVSRQPTGGVFMMTSREATVQRPKRLWRPEQRAGMELQALEAAVRSASEDLVTQLGRR